MPKKPHDPPKPDLKLVRETATYSAEEKLALNAACWFLSKVKKISLIRTGSLLGIATTTVFNNVKAYDAHVEKQKAASKALGDLTILHDLTPLTYAAPFSVAARRVEQLMMVACEQCRLDPSTWNFEKLGIATKAVVSLREMRTKEKLIKDAEKKQADGSRGYVRVIAQLPHNDRDDVPEDPTLDDLDLPDEGAPTVDETTPND